MEVVFLAANKPIAKKYTRNEDGTIHKESYPFIYEVTSEAEDIQNIEQFHTAISNAAMDNKCLLKGKLNRPLVNETRAGSTSPDDKTRWICLDLDGIESYQNIELFLGDIGLPDIDYIIQWSSSMNIEKSSGFRCHIFMLLEEEIHPKLLKHWLMSKNLQIPTIASQLQLAKTNNSLIWPLDITTCQNDKLLYIAPPIIGEGIIDPFPGNERIRLVKKNNRTIRDLGPIPTREALRDQTDKKVNELREANGLPKRKKSSFKHSGRTEYLANPDSAVVTDIKTERGFVYFNLNGGDSWGYFHPIDNPNFISNFKGEPTYKTKELLPDYWADLQHQNAQFNPKSNGVTYLAFRDFRTSNYYNGIYDEANQTFRIARAKSESQLRDFMLQHNAPIGDFIPDWDVVWDPHSKIVVDRNSKTLNTYQRSKFYRRVDGFEDSSTDDRGGNTQFQTIRHVIYHVLGESPESYEHFINWLSYIVQNRSKTGTAWVLQGTQGTGKGVLYHHILTPIFGFDNVVTKRMEELESEFTGFMENKFVTFIDEIESGHSLYHAKITAKLKNLIVEPVISIRRMYEPAYLATNYNNMIFASNKPAAVEIPPDDRRFNVGDYQRKSIQISRKEIEQDIPNELEAFFDYLWNYKVDEHKARTPLNNKAKQLITHITQTSMDALLSALRNGDFNFFVDQLPSSSHEVKALKMEAYARYKAVLKRVASTKTTALSRDEIHALCEWCVGKVPDSPHKFASMLKHHDFHLAQVWVNGKNARGYDVGQWQTTDNEFNQILKDLKSDE